MKKLTLLVCLTAALVAVTSFTWAQRSTTAGGPPYSPARKAGPTLYVSGQVARTATGQDVRGSVEAETRQVMENLGRILKEHGYSFDDVVSATVYLSDINDYQAMNKVYASFFKKEYPARACIGGASLVFGFKVEISCIAYKEGK